MVKPSRLLPLLALGMALAVVQAPEAAAMCGGNVFATCAPRSSAVAPASAAKPAAAPRRRKAARAPALRR